MFALDCSLDKPRIPPAAASELQCQLELRALPELAAATHSGSGTGMSTHVCLVFDCSGSMAGRKAEAAIEAAHLIVDTIDERHRVSLVGFSTSHWVLVDNARPAEIGREPIKRQIDKLRNLVRGGTNLAEGIRRGISVTHRQQTDANVLVILSDGQADSPDEAYKAGIEASQQGIQVFAVGIGDDFKADHLLEVVKPSNGAIFGERDAAKLKAAFGVLLGRIESFIATHVQITLSLHQGVHPTAAYKTGPERAFIGNLSPADRTIRLPVGNVERGQRYGFLLSLTAPPGEPGPRELGRATLRFDVPALRLRGQQVDVAIGVIYDPAAKAANPEVTRAYHRAQIAQLIDELAASEERGDAAKSTELLRDLVRRSEELGDKTLLAEVRGVTPPIAQAKLNAIVLAGTARTSATSAAPASSAPAPRAEPAGPPPAPRPPAATPATGTPAVPAPAPPQRAAPPPAPAAVPPAKPDVPLYDVVLVAPGDGVIELVRQIRELTGFGLSKIHEVIKDAPATLTAVPNSEALALKKRLEALGARIELRLQSRS